MKYQILVVCLTALLAQTVFAGFDKEMLKEVGTKCKEETGTSDEDVKKLMNSEMPTSDEAKCMMACVFKKIGIMKADGTYDEEANKKAAAEMFKGNEEKLKKAEEFSKLCRDRVNGVEDNDKGCKRAAVMLECAMEKAKELGYKEE